MNPRTACRNAGLVCIALSAFVTVAGFAQSANWIAIPSLDPSPSPSPSSRPTPISQEHGGPIAISIIGNLIAGKSYANGTTGADAGTVSDAGAVLSLTRRTPNTSAEVTLPASIAGNGTAVGQFTAEYDTTHSSFLYGPQQVGALGLVPAGTTGRGPAILLPRKHGDVTLYAGLVGGDTAFFVRGARLRTIGARGVSTIALYDAAAHGGGRIDGALLGLISKPNHISGELELGFEHHVNLGLDPSGNPIANGTAFALEGRVDDGNSRQYASLNVRDISPNYVALGGQSQSDRFASLSYRARLGNAPYTATVEEDRVGGVGNLQDTLRQSLSLSEPFGKGGTAIVALTNQSSTTPTDVAWTGNGSLALSYSTKLLAFNLAAGGSRSTDFLGSPNASTNFGFGISRALGTLALQAQVAYVRSMSSTGNDAAPTLTVGASRATGKTTYTLNTQFGRQFQPGSALAFVTPTLSVSRRLSNVFVATVNAALQFRHDALLPSADGHSAQFSFSLGAPFAIGNGIVSGRANPRLPGTISGVVQSDVTAGLGSVPIGGAVGASNITVVLDDQRIVRTDVQGRFAFNFIPAGTHQITIDPASLPRGTQAAAPITTVQLQGGQLAQLVLGIGAFGSILGTVQGGNAAATPISGVAVLLDDKTRAVTDAHGAFAFGALTAGQHSVAILPDSFPASFGMTSTTTQKVAVATGEATRVSFVGAALGSIGGRVTLDKDQDKPDSGVSNAYVVANPGDHAAITDDDGAFLLDNLPPGKYTLTVDAETLPEGLTVTSELPPPLNLEGGAHITGLSFRVGEGEKGVVFTFNGAETNLVTARALTKRLPPGGSTSVVVKTSQLATKVTLADFGMEIPLVYHAATKTWAGIARVPAGAKSGPVSIGVHATGKTNGTTDVEIVVDPTIPIASLVLNPPNPARGQYVHVRAHFLTDAREGDKILWQDGIATILPKPRTGRYFEFDVKISTIPFRGALVTPSGQLPLTLVR